MSSQQLRSDVSVHLSNRRHHFATDESLRCEVCGSLYNFLSNMCPGRKLTPDELQRINIGELNWRMRK
jgi:hypothetical protein